MLHTIILGDMCNMRCAYCLEHSKDYRNTIKFEYIERYLTLLFGEANVFKQNKDDYQLLDLVGGEPLLYMDIIRKTTNLYASLLRDNGYMAPHIHIFTNGYLIDRDEVQDYLHAWKDHLILGVSMDGIASMHNKTRTLINGDPTFDKIYNNLKQIPCNFMIQMTLDPRNIEEYAETRKFFCEAGYQLQTGINCTNPDWGTWGYKVYYEQVKKFFDWYRNHSSEWILQHRFFFTDRNFRPRFIDACFNTIMCNEVEGIMLDYDGTVIPCISCSAVAAKEHRPNFGNIMSDVDWEAARYIPRYGDFDLDIKSECYVCPVGTNNCKPCIYAKDVYCTQAEQGRKYLCNILMLLHLEFVLFNNYWITIYKEKYPDEKPTIKDGAISYNNVPVLDILVSKTWALEVLTEEEYNYLVDLTLSLGGKVNPIKTKHFTLEQAEEFTKYLKQTR